MRTYNLAFFLFDNEPSSLLRFDYNLGKVEVFSAD